MSADICNALRWGRLVRIRRLKSSSTGRLAWAASIRHRQGAEVFNLILSWHEEKPSSFPVRDKSFSTGATWTITANDFINWRHPDGRHPLVDLGGS